MKLICSFFFAGSRSREGRHFVLAALIAMVVSAAIFACLLKVQLRITVPAEMMGCLAFVKDINITNRLFAVRVFYASNLIVFLCSISNPLLGKVTDNNYWTTLCGKWDLWAEFSKQTLCQAASMVVALGKADSSLQASRRQNFRLLAIGILLSLAGPDALYAALRLFLAEYLPHQAVPVLLIVKPILCVAMYLFPMILVLLWLYTPSTTLRSTVLALQGVLLCYYVKLLPDYIYDSGTLIQPLPQGRLAVLVVFLLIAGLGEIYWRYRREFGEGLFSRVALFALVVGVTELNGYTPSLQQGSFEVGARVPPFWMSWNGTLSLFKDLYITFGLYDYFCYALGLLTYGQNTVIAALAGTPLLHVILRLAIFCVTMGQLPLAASLVLAGLIPTGQPTVVFLYAAALLHPLLVRRPTLWISVWLVLSSFFPFARIPQGTMCVIASFPGAFMQSVHLFSVNRRKFFLIATCAVITSVAVICWPFGEYFWGLIRIFTETAAINAPWAANSAVWWARRPDILLAGYGFFLLPLLAFYSVNVIASDPTVDKHAIYAATAVFLFIVVYLFVGISYGFSRMDYRLVTRQSWIVMSLIPVLFLTILLYCPIKNMKRNTLFILIIIFANRVEIPFPGKALFEKKSFAEVDPSKEVLLHYSSESLGIGFYPLNYQKEAHSVRTVLDSILAPDETFLNLSMDGMHYISSGRKLLTEYPVYYVYPGDKPQLRALKVLDLNRVCVTLLDHSQVFDESPVNLRTFYLYRYALQHGLPLKISPTKTLLMPREYFTRIGLTAPDDVAAIRLLDEQFPDKDLGLIPNVWGRGFAKFRDKLHPVHDFVRPLSDEPGTSLLHLAKPLKGADGGLLVLELTMEGDKEIPCTVYWRNELPDTGKNYVTFIARSGTHIVPLDSSPRWLMAGSISALGVRTDPAVHVDVNRAQLFAR